MGVWRSKTIRHIEIRTRIKGKDAEGRRGDYNPGWFNKEIQIERHYFQPNRSNPVDWVNKRLYRKIDNKVKKDGEMEVYDIYTTYYLLSYEWELTNVWDEKVFI